MFVDRNRRRNNWALSHKFPNIEGQTDDPSVAVCRFPGSTFPSSSLICNDEEVCFKKMGAKREHFDSVYKWWPNVVCSYTFKFSKLCHDSSY